MAELISKHSIKIQIGVLVAFIVSAGAFTWNFGWKTSELTSAVQVNTSNIQKMEPHVDQVPVLKAMYTDVKEDISEIKEILNRK